MLFSFCLAAVPIPLLLYTYKINNRILLWLLIIVPPLLLCPLAVIPIRSPISLCAIWLPVLPYLVASIIILIVRIVRIIKKPYDKMRRIKLVRPTLVIVIFVLAFCCHGVSKNMANKYLFELAQDIQSRCNSNGIRPESMEGWQSGVSLLTKKCYFKSEIRKLGIRYPLHYYPSDDEKSFNVEIIHGFNMGIYVKGGVGKELKAFYSCEAGEWEIPIMANKRLSEP